MLTWSSGHALTDLVGLAHGVEPPLDLARLGQLARLRIVERLPGPAEHLGVVARNQEVERFVPLRVASLKISPPRRSPKSLLKASSPHRRSASRMRSACSVSGGNG